MFGPFRASSALSGGLLWKIPWRMSSPQKARQRKRLRMVDNVVATVAAALERSASKPTTAATTATTATTTKSIQRWQAEMPRECEMRPKDKYTFFDRKEKRYRKGVHKLPKWTRVSQRLNPPGF